jgi:hypothetical protein
MHSALYVPKIFGFSLHSVFAVTEEHFNFVEKKCSLVQTFTGILFVFQIQIKYYMMGKRLLLQWQKVIVHLFLVLCITIIVHLVLLKPNGLGSRISGPPEIIMSIDTSTCPHYYFKHSDPYLLFQNYKLILNILSMTEWQVY